jgi:glycosyltransferase involved in cell wall biosynthesis
MRKLIIQIPCFNEAESLPITLADLPRRIDGFGVVEWLVIDDGSTDKTADVARRNGVDHVIRLPHNSGLARAFMAGIDACLRLGADVIVNTDADNQYVAACIPDLVKPILEGKALIVIGARPIDDIKDFSAAKRLLQRLGSWAVRILSSTRVPDAPSGFRAIHRDAAERLYVFSKYTYTLETIIQAGRQGIPITSVPIRVNGYLRPSRLVRSIPSYVWRSILTIFRIFVLYKPLRFFAILGAALFLPGAIIGLRFLAYFLAGDGDGHIQSLILAAIMIISAAFLWVAGMISDLVAANRILLEDIRSRLLRTELRAGESGESVPADGARGQ